MIEAYQKTEGVHTKERINRINKAWHGSAFDPEKTMVFSRALSFLPAWTLVEASDYTSVPEKRAVGLDDGESVTIISYNQNFISDFMAAQKAVITTETVSDYTRFWLQYARLNQERMVLVDDADDIPWREDVTPQARKSLSRSITPLTYLSHEGHVFMLKGCLFFKDSLFECMIEVTSKGRVTLPHQTLIAESLMVFDPLTGT